MRHYYHALHRCGHAAFWSNPDVAADMHLRYDCPWCGGETKRDFPVKPSVIVFNDRVRCVACEEHGTQEEIGTVALYHHRADDACCAIGVAATIVARKAREDEPQ